MQVQHAKSFLLSRPALLPSSCLPRPQAWHNTYTRPSTLVSADPTGQATPSDPSGPKPPDSQPPIKSAITSKPSTLQLQIDARRRFGALAAETASKPQQSTLSATPRQATQEAASKSRPPQSIARESPVVRGSQSISSSTDQQLGGQSVAGATIDPWSNPRTESSSNSSSNSTYEESVSKPQMDAKTVDAFQQEIDEAERSLKENWQRLLHGGRPAPATWRAATREAAADAISEVNVSSIKPDNNKQGRASQPAADGGGHSAAESDPEGPLLPITFRDTWATQALLLVTSVVFAMQWAPLAGPMLQQLQGGHLDVLGLVALACPDTPVCTSLQLASTHVMEGHWASLLTSSLLHGGALPFLFAFTSLQDVGATLQVAEGPLLFACIYFIAGAAASMAQLLIAQQPAGIAGTGAVVGLYSALAVHSWKTGQGRILGGKDAVVLSVAACFSAFQPNLGLWSFMGGAVGGAVASLMSMQILVLLRFAVYLPLVGITFAIDVATKLPRMILSAFINTLVFLASGAVEVVKTIRGL